MSRQYFDFSSLIADFANRFQVVTYTEKGYDSAGDWQEGNKKTTELTGAIVNFKESRLYRSDGSITTKDKRLFMQKRLPEALVGATVVYKGQTYKIDSELENAEFTGVYSYLLKWVSAFD